jgi:hypothetical protein
MEFRDILIMPSRTGIAMGQYLRDAGPVWPRFTRHSALRFHRNGKIFDRKPRDWDGPVDHLDETMLWGGTVVHQFGHIVSETMPRAFAISRMYPELRVLFVAPDEATFGSMPDFFRELCDWLGIPPERVCLLTRPTKVGSLIAIPQPEHLDGPPPPASYLLALEENALRQRLQPAVSELTYVCRLGMLHQLRGGHVGESQIAAALVRLGHRVLDPTTMPLRRQLETYAGARKLVFAEGSAQLVRRLLGRIDQQIVVIQRRPESFIGAQTLKVRVTGIRYEDTMAHMIVPVGRTGAPPTYKALSIHDLPRLFDVFRGLGADLQLVWDQKAYEAAVVFDAHAWWMRIARAADIYDVEATAAALVEGLVKTGHWRDDDGGEATRAGPAVERLDRFFDLRTAADDRADDGL